MNLLFSYKKHIINGVFLLFLIFPLIYFSYLLKNTFLDDSYITLTYSKHFFEEGKPWYNTIDTVQGNGQTSIIWMLMQSLFFNFKTINPIYINKFVSFLLILSVFFTLFNGFKKQETLFIKLFSIFFILFFSFWSALNISHGLETIFYATTLFYYFKYRNRKVGYFFAFLLPLIRPEAMIVSLSFVLETKIFSKLFFYRILCVAASVFTFLFYTIYYYNVWIPLPFLLKNIHEFTPEKIKNCLIVLAVFAPIIVYVMRDFKTKFVFYFPLFFFIIYYSFFIDEVMNFFDRYHFPLFMYFVYFLIDEKHIFSRFKLLKYGAFLISVVGFFYYFDYNNQQKIFYTHTYAIGMKNGPEFIGKYFKNKSKEENKKFKIINSDAGAVAYFSDCYLYDTWGLNNATLLFEKKEKNWSGYLKYLENIKPNYIVLISRESNTFVPRLDFEERIYNYFSLSSQTPILVRKFSEQYYYFIYKTND
jgi:hypothetical protein